METMTDNERKAFEKAQEARRDLEDFCSFQESCFKCPFCRSSGKADIHCAVNKPYTFENKGKE